MPSGGMVYFAGIFCLLWKFLLGVVFLDDFENVLWWS
jgi:hypothetical protein